jgi:ribosome recycling factor
MEVDKIVEHCKSNMHKALEHLATEHVKIRAGKASADMLDGIMVEYYGMPTAISSVASISNLDARTLTISPFEKNMLGLIEKAIMQSNIGVTPSNDGILIKIFMPPLSEERRKEFVKKAHAEGEVAKIAIRNIRRDGIEHVKKAQKDGLSEDQSKSLETNVQQVTDKCIAQVDSICAAKEKDLLTV